MSDTELPCNEPITDLEFVETSEPASDSGAETEVREEDDLPLFHPNFAEYTNNMPPSILEKVRRRLMEPIRASKKRYTAAELRADDPAVGAALKNACEVYQRKRDRARQRARAKSAAENRRPRGRPRLQPDGAGAAAAPVETLHPMYDYVKPAKPAPNDTRPVLLRSFSSKRTV